MHVQRQALADPAPLSVDNTSVLKPTRRFFGARHRRRIQRIVFRLLIPRSRKQSRLHTPTLAGIARPSTGSHWNALPCGKQSGRTQEIQRLIGRSLRSVFDLSALGERSILLDCDVLQADGGTRTAAITGAFVAAHDAVSWLLEQGRIERTPIRDAVAAVSVGIVQGTPLLDLEYVEDSACDTDMNVVMTGGGHFVEVQGTAEGAAFSRAEMDALLALADRGIRELVSLQQVALAAPRP